MDHTIPAVARAFDLLDRLAQTGGDGMADLSRELGVPRSTVYRILNTLQERGVVLREGDGRYRLGPRLLHLARAAGRAFDPVALAMPVMSALAADIGLNVKLSVIDAGNALVVAVAEGRGNLTISSAIGRRFPLHAGAASKLLLAYAEADLREAVLAGPLEALTSKTVTDPALLAAELETIRTEGIAADRSEYALGIDALAVPVFAANGSCLGALSIPFPAEARGILGHRIEEGLRMAARQIGALVGHVA